MSSVNPDDAEKAIRARVSVTQQRVLIAKAIIVQSAVFSCTSEDLFAAVLKANDVAAPKTVVLHESVDTTAAINAVADELSWRLAAGEAIWSLIHSGILFSLSEARGDAPSIGWTTVVPGGGGMSSGWRFEDYTLPVPGRLQRAHSLTGAPIQFLAEPDLYLHSLGIAGMHAEVAQSFREAVKCFRAELFTASVSMLGKASEGAWLELGASLLEFIPLAEEQKYSKQRSVLEDPMAGPLRKVEAVLAIYDHQEHFGLITKASGVKLQELRTVAVWSDAVRDSRNTIHFGVTPATPNTYEKVAALLIGAVPYIRTLYRVKDAAEASR